MSIFKKKQRSIYESQPRIDFNDSRPTAPIVHSDQPLEQPLTKPVLAPETPFQKANFERESEVQPSSEVSSNTSLLTTGFIADSYNDAPKMADLLLTKGQLIVHLEKLPKGERVRLLDFISGVMYAFNGDVQKIEHRTYQFQFKKMLNKTQLLQHYQQDYELINKIKGWCEQAHRGQVVNTDFLDLRQIAILQAILAQENITNYFIHKPLTNGFRATVSFNATHDNTVILHAKQPTPHFFQHHQVLGFILNQLQLEMRVIGDLYITANDLYLSVLKKIMPVFINAPLIIQKNLLTWTINPAPVVIEYQFTVFVKTVKSLRLDAVVSALCNVSRQQAQKYVEQNYVYVNFSVVNNKTFQVACDIIISIKRYGRFKINAILPSKNQHYRITIAKFA